MPVGAVLAGSAELIEEAWRFKQMMGGSLRQAVHQVAGKHDHRSRDADPLVHPQHDGSIAETGGQNVEHATDQVGRAQPISKSDLKDRRRWRGNA